MTFAALDSELSAILRDRGQRVTPQRLVIGRLLRQHKVHLTAEQVRDAVSATLPGTSLPTVYATLELFEEVGIVRKLDIAGGPAIFDSRTDDHHHAVCRICGAVRDLDVTIDGAAVLAAAREAGYTTDHLAIVVDGVCAACTRA